jgi:chemotaxis protein MotA
MDIATLIGLVAVIGVIIGAISLGGDIMVFVNIPSIVVVIGGTLAATVIRVSLKQFMGSFKVGLKAVLHKSTPPETLIEEAVALANIARKDGILALESAEISDPFLEKGIGMCIDGHPPEVVQQMLSKDINLTIERHDIGVNMFKAIGDYAPAMGMIGTLIGLVQMLANMSDPKSIGPAMAVALLTTLYGAIIANGFALPISEKLKGISKEEKLAKSLILESISSIQAGTNPRVMEQLLMAYLPESKRVSGDEQPAE